MAQELERFCPKCGRAGSERKCPRDGTAMIERTAISLAADSFRTGTLVAGRYKVLGTLGRGGFGAVYSAEHAVTGQPVALKVLAGEVETAEDDVVRRFFQEARVMSQLKSPHTVRLYDFGTTDDGVIFMALEHVNGPTLEAILRDRERVGGALTEKETIDFGIQILRSLGEAHTVELVHRDLKPANIMFSQVAGEDAVLKVLDFGIARTKESSLTGGGKALGTPYYMSPEQCRGLEVDGRSDLYSLGVILYRCVCGNLPFFDRNPMNVLRMHDSAPIPRLHENSKTQVSDGLSYVVTRALGKLPGARFADAKEMRSTLEHVRDGTWSPPELDDRTRVGSAASQVDDEATRYSSALGTPSPPSIHFERSSTRGQSPATSNPATPKPIQARAQAKISESASGTKGMDEEADRLGGTLVFDSRRVDAIGSKPQQVSASRSRQTSEGQPKTANDTTERPGGQGPEASSTQQTSKQTSLGPIVGVIVALAVVGGAAVWWFGTDKSSPVAGKMAQEPERPAKREPALVAEQQPTTAPQPANADESKEAAAKPAEAPVPDSGSERKLAMAQIDSLAAEYESLVQAATAPSHDLGALKGKLDGLNSRAKGALEAAKSKLSEDDAKLVDAYYNQKIDPAAAKVAGALRQAEPTKKALAPKASAPRGGSKKDDYSL